uniref:Uncharacterized protein n=1 Tax=Avena sativa TaxID=4498 RepID=A0ACD5ZQT2_AVESA
MEGWVKLNVDGSYIQNDGQAGAGMILRDHQGEVIYTACRCLVNCSSALEEELAACEEGLRLALNWSVQPIVVEMDCSVGVAMLNAATKDKSSLVHLVTSIKELLNEKGSTVTKIHRSQNMSSHTMAKLGRSKARTQFWIRNFPQELHDIVTNECNFPIS